MTYSRNQESMNPWLVSWGHGRTDQVIRVRTQEWFWSWRPGVMVVKGRLDWSY